MRLINTSKIAPELRKVNPSQIAVAYVGNDWEKFIDPDFLREIIISPTLGSNPQAIMQISEKLNGSKKDNDWKNVYFLDKLHTKMYIGNHSAAVGSFNLSRNGISAIGLEELGIVTDDIAVVKELRTEFKRLKALSQRSYPTTQSKIERLEVLRNLRNRAISEGLISENDKVPQLEEYRPIKDDFFVTWVMGECPGIDYARMGVENQDIDTEEKFINVADDYLNFLEEDQVKENTWILIWEAQSSGSPMISSKARWFYVDRVICQIVKDEIYTKLVVQFKNKSPRSGPFDLSRDAVQSALREVLSSSDFSEFRNDGVNPWSFEPSKNKLLEFMAEVKRVLANR